MTAMVVLRRCAVGRLPVGLTSGGVSGYRHAARYTTRVYIGLRKGAITSKIKHEIKLKTSPARLHNCCTTVAALISILL